MIAERLFSPTAREAAQSYIANQEQHHQVKTSREEYIEMLIATGIEFDEQYVE